MFTLKIVWLAALFTFLIGLNEAFGNLKVAIVKSNDNSCNPFAAAWVNNANALGFMPTEVTPAFLNQPISITQADIIVIACDKVSLTDAQRDHLSNYVGAGGSVYLQAEFRCEKPNNQAFEYIVKAQGGNFNWESSHNGNLIPQVILGTMGSMYETLPTMPNAFYFGCNGISGEHVKPILQYKGLHFGFMFCSPRQNGGRMICISDQDWLLYENASVTNQLIKNIYTHLNKNINPALVCYSSALGINFDKFEILSLNKKVIGVAWRLNPQGPSDAFELEVSYEGAPFKRVSTVYAELGKDDYKYYYNAPEPGNYIIRIHWLGENQSTYTEGLLVKVPSFSKSPGISVQQNEQELLLVTDFTQTQTVNYKFYDAAGRIVLQGNIEATSGVYIFPNLDNLPSGIYRISTQAGVNNTVSTFLKKN